MQSSTKVRFYIMHFLRSFLPFPPSTSIFLFTRNRRGVLLQCGEIYDISTETMRLQYPTFWLILCTVLLFRNRERLLGQLRALTFSMLTLSRLVGRQPKKTFPHAPTATARYPKVSSNSNMSVSQDTSVSDISSPTLCSLTVSKFSNAPTSPVVVSF